MNTEALKPLSNNPPTYPPSNSSPSALAIQKFASDNGFEFYLRRPELVEYSWRDYKKLPAYLGMIGPTATKDAYYVVTGKLMGYPLTIYLMWDNLIDGKYYDLSNEQQKNEYTQQQTTGIIKLTLPKVFPQIVLDSNKDDRMWSSIHTEFNMSQRVNLEGDFSEFFDLYIPSGLQINALSLLAPNMMQILKNHSGIFDVEFFGNEMVLMTRRPLYDPVNMELLKDALTEEFTYMDILMQSWHYSPNSKPFDLLTRPAVGGNNLKIGWLRVGAKAQLVAVSVFFLVFAIIIIALK